MEKEERLNRRVKELEKKEWKGNMKKGKERITVDRDGERREERRNE